MENNIIHETEIEMDKEESFLNTRQLFTDNVATTSTGHIPYNIQGKKCMLFTVPNWLTK